MQSTQTNRRDLLTLGTAGLLLSLTETSLADDDANVEPSQLEQDNAALVTDFCKSWSTIDVDQIAGYLDDKIVYQMFEGMPEIKGKEDFIKRIKPFFAAIDRVEWDILRTHTIGNLVINERVDHFYRKDDKPDMHFPVAGFFVVKDGKIRIWRDYGMPKPKKDEA